MILASWYKVSPSKRVKTSQVAMNLCWISAFVLCGGTDFDLILEALKPDSVCHGITDWWHSRSYFPKYIPAGIKIFPLICLWMHVLISTLRLVITSLLAVLECMSCAAPWAIGRKFPPKFCCLFILFRPADLSDSVIQSSVGLH